jgi:Domain of unknown function (DUF4351)
MPRKAHDSFVKEWMQELLTDFGTVETEVEIAGEVGTIDVLFYPAKQSPYPLEPLGSFGQLLAQPSMIEAFRNAVSEWDIRNCKGKLWMLEGELRRAARRTDRSTHRVKPPLLWILTPTLSKALQKKFVPPSTEERNGIYFLLEGEKTAIVVIHQLPKTLDTLWLRLLGRDKVQEEAIDTLFDLPANHPYRTQTLEHLSMLQINLKARQNKTKAIKEVIMGLSPVYEKWREETLSQGRQEGRQEGQILLLNLLLEQKFGSMTDRLSHRIAQLTSQQCEQLAIDLSTLKNLKTLEQWLERNSPST